MASWQPFWESSLIMSKDRFAPKVTLSPRGRSDVQGQFCVISECYLVPPISFPNLTDTPLEQLFTSWKCEFGSLDWDSGICHFHFCLSLLFQGSSIILGYVVLGPGLLWHSWAYKSPGDLVKNADPDWVGQARASDSTSMFGSQDTQCCRSTYHTLSHNLVPAQYVKLSENTVDSTQCRVLFVHWLVRIPYSDFEETSKQTKK